MRNMPEINRESRSVILLNTDHHHALVKANRVLLLMVVALMAVVFVLGFVLLPDYSITNQSNHNREAVSAMMQQNSGVSAEIQKLKGQMFGLVSGSIESKLRSLEDNIRRGSVAESLDTIQDIKNDVKVLNTYSSDPATTTPVEANTNKQLIDELSQLKNLVYLTFVSCGLMIAAVAGIWLRNRNRLPHRPVQRIFWAEDE